MAATLLRIVLVVGGIAAVGASLSHIALGGAAVPGGMPVNATLDSEERFYACFFLAYGALALWCARQVQARRTAIGWLALVLFAGGSARLLSVAMAGWPHPFFIAMTAVELGLPLLIWACLRRLPP